MSDFLICDLCEVILEGEQFAILANLMRANKRALQMCVPQVQEYCEKAEGRPPVEIDSHGYKFWKDRHGRIHSDGDKPAVIHVGGTQFWYTRGELHRDGDKPAVIRADDSQAWFVRGQLHRNSVDGYPPGPAVIHANGTRFWYDHDQCHRDGDKPAIIDADGTQCWYIRGKLHRDGDKPAVIYADGSQYWYQHGQLHRNGNKPTVIGMDDWYRREKHIHRNGGPATIYAVHVIGKLDPRLFYRGAKKWYFRGRCRYEDTTIDIMMREFSTLTVKILRERCKQANIRGYSKMRKAELIQVLAQLSQHSDGKRTRTSANPLDTADDGIDT